MAQESPFSDSFISAKPKILLQKVSSLILEYYSIYTKANSPRIRLQIAIIFTETVAFQLQSAITLYPAELIDILGE